MLARIVGKNNVVARVSVNLNTKSSTLLDEKFDPEGQVPVPKPPTRIRLQPLKLSLRTKVLVWRLMYLMSVRMQLLKNP